jgi:hypothetical protein
MNDEEIKIVLETKKQENDEYYNIQAEIARRTQDWEGVKSYSQENLAEKAQNVDKSRSCCLETPKISDYCGGVHHPIHPHFRGSCTQVCLS